MLVGYAFCALVGIFSFVLLLLNVNFLFVHFSYVVVLLALLSCVVVGASCGLLLLFLSHYLFRTTTILIHYCLSHFHSSLGYSSHCWSSRATTLLMLPLFSHYSSCLATPFTLLFFELSHLSHFKRLLASLCCSSRITILDPFALLLLCFVWLVSYFPCHGVRHQLKHQMWIFFAYFPFFWVFNIIVVLFSIFSFVVFLLLFLHFCYLFFLVHLCCFFSISTNFLIRVLHCFFCKFLKT
jgi:hypothetical protein